MPRLCAEILCCGADTNPVTQAPRTSRPRVVARITETWTAHAARRGPLAATLQASSQNCDSPKSPGCFGCPNALPCRQDARRGRGSPRAFSSNRCDRTVQHTSSRRRCTPCDTASGRIFGWLGSAWRTSPIRSATRWRRRRSTGRFSRSTFARLWESSPGRFRGRKSLLRPQNRVTHDGQDGSEIRKLLQAWDLDDDATGVAERVGFEPTVRFPVHTLSKRAPSTTRTSLRACRISSLQASG